MKIAISKRLQKLPPNIFVEIDKLKKQAIARGVDIINFGIGDPDLPTPKPVIDALAKAARDKANHTYPSCEGKPELRETVAEYYEKRFGVKLDPINEICSVIGSKEGIANTAGALINPGETVALPDPNYPMYGSGTMFAGGKSYPYFLNKKNGFLADLEKLPASVLSRIKILWLCNPHAPTTRVAPKSYLKKVVALAKKHGFFICNDAAYADVYFDGEKPPSILEIPGAKSVAMEFYSCSKSFNMTGWRLAFALGNKHMIAALRQYKNNMDSGQFGAVQEAGITAFKNAGKIIAANTRVYQSRRDLLADGLKRLGWEIDVPKATFYFWIPTRHAMTSMQMCKTLLKDCGIVALPGIGLGSRSDDYIRLALTTPESRIRQALARIRKAGI